FSYGKSGRIVPATNAGDNVAEEYDLLIGADGVWSSLRAAIGAPAAAFTGNIAYRALIGRPAETPAMGDVVTTFLSPDMHLVAYPVSGGDTLNLVLVAPGAKPEERRWDKRTNHKNLIAAYPGL